MSITTYPLNGITYDAADAETYLCTRTSGVFADYDCFDISITDDMLVTISPGLAWIRNTDFRGKSVCMDEEETLTISAGDATYDRIDRIVLNFSTVENETTILVLEGDPSSSPSAPEITQEYEQYQLGLYEIEVPAGCIELDESYITDTRLDSDVCGKMTDSVTDLYEYMLVATYDPEGGARQVAFADTTVTHETDTAVGSGTNPVYVASDGTITASSSTVGSSTKPVYLSSGTITASSSTVGSSTKPVYLSSGTITAFNADMGGSNYPVYLSEGAITPCTATVGSSSSATAVPIYMKSGVLTAIASTIGGAKQSMYMTEGTLKAGFKVDYGTVSITTTSNGTSSKSVTFATSFSNTPTVVVSAHTSVPGTRTAGCNSVSTTGMTIYLYNGNSTSTSVSVTWVAIATS